CMVATGLRVVWFGVEVGRSKVEVEAAMPILILCWFINLIVVGISLNKFDRIITVLDQTGKVEEILESHGIRTNSISKLLPMFLLGGIGIWMGVNTYTNFSSQALQNTTWLLSIAKEGKLFLLNQDTRNTSSLDQNYSLEQLVFGLLSRVSFFYGTLVTVCGHVTCLVLSISGWAIVKSFIGHLSSEDLKKYPCHVRT
ncbi:unnamed protein product, partial [Allacma fusca]